MAETSPTSAIDDAFYRPADAFFRENSKVALTYDDVTLATLYSEVLPRETQLDTTLAEGIQLHIPIVSADMDTVTESPMAIAMALAGGLGLIHCNMPERQQLSEVSRVKNNVHGLIQEPIKVAPDQSIGDVLALIEERRFDFRTFPVVDAHNKLLGLLPGHVVRPRYAAQKVAAAMTPRAQVQTIHERELGADPIARADRFFTEHIGIHKLLVVDELDELRGLFTISDIERIMHERHVQLKPARDSEFRLLCGAAVSATRNSTGALDTERIRAHVGGLVERGVDVIAVSTAHGFSKGVGDTVRLVRETFPRLPIIAGNVTSAAGVEYLAECGADIVKVGQGPGSICTTRIVAGVGIPQLTALYICSRAAAKEHGVTHPRRWRHRDEVRRHRQSAHPGGWCHVRRPARRLPRGARPDASKSTARFTSSTAAWVQPRRHAVPAAPPATAHGSRDTMRKDRRGGCGSAERTKPRRSIPCSTQLTGGLQSGMGYLGARTTSPMHCAARPATSASPPPASARAPRTMWSK